MFAYCKNNPICLFDNSGFEALSAFLSPVAESNPIGLFLLGVCIICLAVVSSSYDITIGDNSLYSNDLTSDYVNGVLFASGVTTGIEYAVIKAKTDNKWTLGSDVHHIVPWRDGRCRDAQQVLSNAGIDPFRDDRNQIRIPRQLHKYLNNDIYDISIDILFTDIDQYTRSRYPNDYQNQLTYNVCLALELIRSALEVASQVIYY